MPNPIIGDDNDNVLVGTEGDDRIEGRGGNDRIFGLGGNDILIGGLGNDTISGGFGDDLAFFNVTTDGADTVDLGPGFDEVSVTAAAAGQVRLTFTSSEVGNGNPNDSNTMANQDGGLAVRLQAEAAGGALTGQVSRFDDEGITFVADTAGLTFDVRDLVSGVERGNAFRVVALGTQDDDEFIPLEGRESEPHYVNGGQGDDIIFGGNGNDFLVGGAGNDILVGGLGDDGILGGAGDDTVFFDVSTDGADRVDLGAGDDLVLVTAAAASQVRLSFTSSEVGNGNPNDSNTMANQDGGLAVRLQAEAADGTLTGPVSRFDDEGITFIADQPGLTFDVRDLVSGVERGDAFRVVALGTQGDDLFTPIVGREGEAHYVNGGQGDDIIFGGTGNDFLVGGAGDDLLVGGDGDDRFITGPGDDVVFGNAGTDRIIYSVAFSAAQVSFSAEGETLITTADGTDTIRGVEQFQFSDRLIDNADGNRLVDDLFYLSQNPDVAAAGVDADVHYATFGFREGRDPNAFFSTTGYLAANPDAVGTNPLDHYQQVGAGRGSDPGANFDNEFYLVRNPDVAAAGVNPLLHFLTFGQGEGREIGPAIGRAGDIGDDNGFDAQFYLLDNTDIAANALTRGGDTFATAFEHYNLFGFREGRDPNAFFDTSDYLADNPDVAAAGVNPIVHYDIFGWREGRDPSDAFDTSFYLQSNPDVAAAGVNPLEHFLQFGIYEGRAATPGLDGTLG